jgi:hypothetical protein
LTSNASDIGTFNFKSVGINVEALRLKSQHAIVGLRILEDWKQKEQNEEAPQFHCFNLYNLGESSRKMREKAKA